MASKSKTTETIEHAVEAGKAQVETMTSHAKKQMEDMTAMAKANYEALVISGEAAQKGIKAMTEAATAYGKTLASETQTTMKALSAAKSPKEFFELHAAATKTAFDKFVGEFSKMSEMYVKVAGDVAAPVSNRVAVVMDKASKKTA